MGPLCNKLTYHRSSEPIENSSGTVSSPEYAQWEFCFVQNCSYLLLYIVLKRFVGFGLFQEISQLTLLIFFHIRTFTLLRSFFMSLTYFPSLGICGFHLATFLIALLSFIRFRWLNNELSMSNCNETTKHNYFIRCYLNKFYC